MDTESLLKSLNAHEVRYVIIGATAFPIHGYAQAAGRAKDMEDIRVLLELKRQKNNSVSESG